jgi:deazaflavin-dependent oxidoreductase (nitroreductase family)
VSQERITEPSLGGGGQPDGKGGAMNAKDRAYVRAGFFMTHVVNPINRRLGLSAMLIVRGRKSGETRVTPLGRPFEYAGARYLVSGRGQTQWVRNLRAAGRCEMRIHGVTEELRAVEVLHAEHDTIVAAYRKKLGRSVDGYFKQIPDSADHPVFRIEPVEATGS